MENKLEKVEKGINFLAGKEGSPTEKVADAVEEVLLEKDEPMSMPDLADHLPYKENEVLRGLEKLEDEFAVKRIEEEDRAPRWKIRLG